MDVGFGRKSGMKMKVTDSTGNGDASKTEALTKELVESIVSSSMNVWKDKAAVLSDPCDLLMQSRLVIE